MKTINCPFRFWGNNCYVSKKKKRKKIFQTKISIPKHDLKTKLFTKTYKEKKNKKVNYEQLVICKKG